MQGFPNYGEGDYSVLIELFAREEWVVVKKLNLTVKRKAAP
jgi:hypothetical protein